MERTCWASSAPNIATWVHTVRKPFLAVTERGIKTEGAVSCCITGERTPQVKELKGFLTVWKGMTTNCLLWPTKITQLSSFPVLSFGDSFWTSHPWNFQTIYLSCFKPVFVVTCCSIDWKLILIFGSNIGVLLQQIPTTRESILNLWAVFGWVLRNTTAQPEIAFHRLWVGVPC